MSAWRRSAALRLLDSTATALAIASCAEVTASRSSAKTTHRSGAPQLDERDEEGLLGGFASVLERDILVKQVVQPRSR